MQQHVKLEQLWRSIMRSCLDIHCIHCIYSCIAPLQSYAAAARLQLPAFTGETPLYQFWKHSIGYHDVVLLLLQLLTVTVLLLRLQKDWCAHMLCFWPLRWSIADPRRECIVALSDSELRTMKQSHLTLMLLLLLLQISVPGSWWILQWPTYCGCVSTDRGRHGWTVQGKLPFWNAANDVSQASDKVQHFSLIFPTSKPIIAEGAYNDK